MCEKIIIPTHFGGICKCGPKYELTLYDDETVTFGRTNQLFSLSETTVIIDEA